MWVRQDCDWYQESAGGPGLRHRTPSEVSAVGIITLNVEVTEEKSRSRLLYQRLRGGNGGPTTWKKVMLWDGPTLVCRRRKEVMNVSGQRGGGQNVHKFATAEGKGFPSPQGEKSKEVTFSGLIEKKNRICGGRENSEGYFILLAEGASAATWGSAATC